MFKFSSVQNIKQFPVNVSLSLLPPPAPSDLYPTEFATSRDNADGPRSGSVPYSTGTLLVQLFQDRESMNIFGLILKREESFENLDLENCFGFRISSFGFLASSIEK
jgi:hypothetical protein